jgi:hypothetical protein
MSEVRSKIPFDSSSGKYRKSWQATQEEQVSTSEAHHIRRFMNPNLILIILLGCL